MRLKTSIKLLIVLIALAVGISAEAATPVHWFDCNVCHKAGTSTTSLVDNNICLQCHKDIPPATAYPDFSNRKPHGVFSTNDASDAMGAATAIGVSPSLQTSHYWASPKDVVLAAGAMAPTSALYRSRYGISNGKVTCTRCHDPHLNKDEADADAFSNKLLRMSSADAMCLNCHRPWNIGNADHGLSTHPMVSDYPTFATDNPDKYKPVSYNATTLVLDTNANQGGVRLVYNSTSANYGISCSSCHGVHFADSNATTDDGVDQSLTTNSGYTTGLTAGDGKLLLSDGRGVYNSTTMGYEGTDASITCQACHTYRTHGADGGEMVGCLICHSGHSYAPSAPNYYVLRKSTSTATYNAATTLDYSVLTTTGGGARTISRAWAGVAGATDSLGYCERCHGEVSTMAGSLRAHPDTGEDCISCHKHHTAAGTFSFEANCTDCHGYPPKQNVAGGPDGFAVDGAVRYNTVSGGTIFKDESATPHNTHAGEYGLSCDNCHKGNSHNSGSTFQDVFLSPTGTLAGAGALYAAANPGTCTVVYCHSNGRSGADARTASATWANGNGTITVCDACHGNDATDMAAGQKNDTAAHAKHLTKGYACNVCHQTTAASASALNLVDGKPPVTHVDGDADVAFDTAYELSVGNPLTVGATPWSGTSCDTVYCHSNGQATPSYTSFAWTASTAGNCGVCHAAGTAMATGSHAAHVNGASGELGRNITCDNCHADTASNNTTLTGGVNTTKHVNGARDVRMSIFSDAGACSSIYCHSNGNTGNLVYASPTWGAALAGCNDCHGDGSVAYPNYANGGLAQVNSNSHAAHIVGGGYACQDCHNTTASGNGILLPGSGQHIDNTLDVAGAKIGSWTDASKTCSTVSCHGGNNPQWGDTLGCADCHMRSAGDVDDFVYNNGTFAMIDTEEWQYSGHGKTTGTYDVTGYNAASFAGAAVGANADECLYCHDSGINHGAANYFRLRQNGKADLNGACLGCHATGSTGVDPDAAGVDYNNKTSVVKIDKYHGGAAHNGTDRDAGRWCWDCHDPHGDADVVGLRIQMIQRRPAVNPDVNGVPASLTATADVVFYNSAIGVGAGGFALDSVTADAAICNTCHTSTDQYRKNLGGNGHPTAQCTLCHGHSDDTTYNQLAFKGSCSKCHGGDIVGTNENNFWPSSAVKTVDNAGSINDSGAHAKHITELATKVYSEDIATLLTDNGNGTSFAKQQVLCGYCHASPGTDADHANSTPADDAEVAQFKTFWDGSADAVTVGSFDRTGAAGKGTCSNIDCHNNVITPDAYAWYSGGTSACIMCHALAPSHAAHTGAAGTYGITITCTDCHESGIAWGTPGTKPESGHLDGTLLVAKPDAFPHFTYNSATGSCGTSDCHNNGAGGAPSVDGLWGVSSFGSCNECHSFWSTYAHQAHIAAEGTIVNGAIGGMGCNKCHTHISVGSSGQHMNQIVDLEAAMNYSGATTVGDASYGTCTTTNCHQNGRGSAQITPLWNRTASSADDCTICHGVSNNGIPVSATPLTQGSHGVHVTAKPSQYNSVAVSSTEGTYEFACSNCHPDVLSKHLNSSNWATPTVDLSLNNTDGGTLKGLNNVANDTGGYAQTRGTSVTCSAAYCHSYVDAAGTRLFPATPNWYSTGFAGDACAGCHGNSPVSNAHEVHEVGIHFDTTYTGVSGLQTAGSTGDNAHGKATTSTVIGCISCHNDTVKAWYNDDNTTCATCHGVTAPAKGSLENASNTNDTANFKKTLHLNGTVDVAFQNIAPKTRAQIRNGIENVPELFSNWERQNGGFLDWLLFYKHTDDYDQAKSTLNSATFSAGTCSAVACHNGYDIEWNKAQASYSCDACHTQLP